MKGIITTIQRMSIHDGPGIRSTIFLKGCNLRCKWCHNPETFEFSPELEWISDKCINCRSCLEHCESGALFVHDGKVQFSKEKCTACFQCVEHCYPESLHVVGREVTTKGLVEEVMQDVPFFNTSGGGITISGGEPMMQAEFVTETLKLLKLKNIHTAIETNLLAPWDSYNKVLDYTDLVMADLKTMNSGLHKLWTGGHNKRILENIRQLDKSGKPYYLRTPLVPGVNDTIEEIEAISAFVSRLENLERFELLPFHPLADSKYRNLGVENPFKNVNSISTGQLEYFMPILKKYKNHRRGVKDIFQVSKQGREAQS